MITQNQIDGLVQDYINCRFALSHRNVFIYVKGIDFDTWRIRYLCSYMTDTTFISQPV